MFNNALDPRNYQRQAHTQLLPKVGPSYSSALNLEAYLTHNLK